MKDNRGRLANKRVDLYTFLNANILHGFFWNVKLLLDKVIVVFFSDGAVTEAVFFFY